MYGCRGGGSVFSTLANTRENLKGTNEFSSIFRSELDQQLFRAHDLSYFTNND